MQCKDLTEKQNEIISSMRERYKQVPPVLFMRSLSMAKNEFELFDILETIPSGFPLAWNAEARKWDQFTPVES